VDGQSISEHESPSGGRSDGLQAEPTLTHGYWAIEPTPGIGSKGEMNMLTARTVALALGFLLLVGCVPEDTKPRDEGARLSEMELIALH
jgi:hypothetical protein